MVEPALFEWDVFEVETPIQSPAKREVRYDIWFLNSICERPVEIHRFLLFVVTLWTGKMWRSGALNSAKEGTDVHNEQRSGRPSLISDELLQEIEGEIRANRHMTIRELHHIIPEVSKTTIHEAVTEKLWYRKLWARWVPKILRSHHRTNRSTLRYVHLLVITNRQCQKTFGPLITNTKICVSTLYFKSPVM